MYNLRFGALTCVLASLPFAMTFPDLSYFAGVEKIGIVGVLSLAVWLLVRDRGKFQTRCGLRLEALEKKVDSLESNVDKRLTGLEASISHGNEAIVSLLNKQLETLREIKDGQAENFRRMWDAQMGHIDRPREPERVLAASQVKDDRLHFHDQT